MNKKGFTLIELLAIIVILAIIAVITVPIILNIIDESKKGAAQDSAYGYKDAVQKYYTTSLFENKDLRLDGKYVVSDGKLAGSGFDSVSIPVSGIIPSQGMLVYSNNQLINGCLVIDNYQVVYSGNKFVIDSKGDCSSKYETTSNSCFTYRDNGNGTATLSAYKCGSDSTGEIDLNPVIPSEIDGLTVTALGSGLFHRKGINSVVIPSTLIEIQAAAFMENNLSFINIPSSVTSIGDAAFQKNKLKSVTIPSSVTVLGEGSFYQNELESIVLNEGLAVIKGGSFYLNHIKEIKVPSTVTTIGTGAFSLNDGLRKIEFPVSTVSMGYNVVVDISDTLQEVVVGGTTYTRDNVGSGVSVGNIVVKYNKYDQFCVNPQ